MLTNLNLITYRHFIRFIFNLLFLWILSGGQDIYEPVKMAKKEKCPKDNHLYLLYPIG